MQLYYCLYLSMKKNILKKSLCYRLQDKTAIFMNHCGADCVRNNFLQLKVRHTFIIRIVRTDKRKRTILINSNRHVCLLLCIYNIIIWPCVYCWRISTYTKSIRDVRPRRSLLFVCALWHTPCNTDKYSLFTLYRIKNSTYRRFNRTHILSENRY